MVSFSRALVLALASAFTLLSTGYSQITPVYNSRNYLIEVTDAPAYAELPNAVNITGGDDRVDYVPLPFTFVFYNRTYPSVNVSANGNIQFRTAATGYSNALFGQGSNLYTPVIAAFFADLYPTAAGQRVWAVTGTAPNRQFIVRWRDVNYCCVAYTPGSGLLMDVILSEGTNNIDIRYYRVLAGTRNVEIGVQYSGDNSRWAYIWNDAPFTAANVTLLQGKNVRFVPQNQPAEGRPLEPISITPIYNSPEYQVVVSDAPARANIPDMTQLRAVTSGVDYIPLGFNFVFYNRSYNSVNVSTHGNVQFRTAATSYGNVLFGPTGTNSYSPVIAAFFAYLYPNTLGQRTYAVTGTAPNRQFILRWNDVSYGSTTGFTGTGLDMDVILTETSNTIDVRYYRIPISWTVARNVEIGIQNSGSGNAQWVAIWNDMTFNEETAAGFTGKNIRYNPVNQDPNGTPPQPIAITPVYNSRSYLVAVTAAPARPVIEGMIAFPAADDACSAVEFGFSFVFYNQTYSSGCVSTNGNVQFMTTATGYANSLFGQTATGSTTFTPIIAAFFSDLYPTNAAQRSYITRGTAPNREFIARFTDVNYCCVAYAPGVGLNMDIVLYETTNNIDIRYYQIPLGTRNVEMGLENRGGSDWVYIWNDEPIVEEVATGWLNKNVRYTPQNQGQAVPTQPDAPITITPVYSTRKYIVAVSDAPARMEIPNMTNLTGRDDGVDAAIPIGFNFHFYNRTFSTVGVSTNGNLQFVTTATGYTNSLFGTSTTANSFTPVIAAFFTDLYPTAANQRTYTTTGTAPNRQFIVRYTDVWYCCQAWQPGVGLSMDIILYETSDVVEVRYYRIPISATTVRRVEIGLQNAGDLNDWVYVWNDEPFNTTSVAAFTNKAIRFTAQNMVPGGPDPDPSDPGTPVTINPVYNTRSYVIEVSDAATQPALPGATNITGVDDGVFNLAIPFTFVFYNRSYNSVGVSSNGNLQFATSSTGYSNSLFGQGTTGNAFSPILAFFFTDLYPRADNQRVWAVTGTAPNRQLVIRFVDVWYCCQAWQPGVGLSMDIILYETSNNIDTRYYRIPISATTVRNVEIGVQNSGNNNADWAYVWNDTPFNAASVAAFTNKQLRYIPQNQPAGGTPLPPVAPVYGSASYLAAISDAPARETITTGMTNITGSDDAVATIPIGFEFVFYNRSYTSLNVGSNGNLQFATTGTGYSNSLFGQDGTAANLITPIIAAFFADMYPRADHQRQYRVTGTAPNRQLMIRWTDVWYCCQAWQPNVGLNMDIILYEGSNNIDLRWYRIPVSTTINRPVEIGLQNSGMNGGDWVYIWNDESFTDSSTSLLTNKQVRFTPQNQAAVPIPPVTITPVYSTRSYVVVVSDAPALAQLAGAVNIAGADDRVDMVTIPFPFTFYNRSYESVGVSTNGNLQFVTASTGYSNSLFGQGVAANSFTPIIAFFFTDLYPTQDHQRSYATIGTAPNRQFIVRYTDVNYCCTAGVPGVGLTMDVILTETSNTVDIRYYQMLASGTRNVEIGLQNMGGDSDWVYVWNDEIFSQPAITAFTGKNIRFNPQNQQNGGIPIPPITITPVVNSPSYTVAVQDAPARGTYTGMTNITGADDTVATNIPIGFSFVFYNQSYTTLNSAPNGNIQFATSSSTFSNSLFGQGAAPSHTPIIAFFFTDLYPTQDYQRTYITTGTAPNRQFILRYTDVNYCCTAGVPGVGLNVDVILFEGTNVIETLYYRILAGTRNVEIGIQNEGASGDWAYVWDDTPFNAQAVRAFTNKMIRYTPVNQGQGRPLVIQPVYAGASAYRVDITQAPSRPAALPGTTVNLRAADDFVDAVPIGFTFNFYGVPYTQVGVSTNGNLQFATNSTGYSNSLFNPGAASAGFAPVVAAFFADLYPTTEGQRTYSVSGTAPNRQLNIRFNDVWFCCTAYEAGRGLQMDIVLTETTNTVDIRYYRIAVATNSIEIGIQNVGIDQYAYVWNDQAFTQRWIDVFQGKQIRFAPPNVPAPSTSVPTGPVNPTAQPTVQPTGQPTVQPTGQPTAQPTTQPTGQPQPSSTGAQVSPVKIKFSFNMPQGANVENVKNALLNDIASTIVRRVGGQQSIIRGYLSMDVASTPSRRLLQNTQTMYATLTLDGNLRSPGMSGDVYSAADAVAGAISEGTLVTDSAQANGVSVPRQTPTVEGGRAQSSSSSSLSGGAIAGIVIGVIVGVLVLAVFCFFALAGYRRGDKYTGHTDVEPSRVSGGADHDSHHDEQEQGEGEVEMETV